MRDTAFNLGPASISTNESDPRHVCGARRLSGASIRSFTVNCLRTHNGGVYTAEEGLPEFLRDCRLAATFLTLKCTLYV